MKILLLTSSDQNSVHFEGIIQNLTKHGFEIDFLNFFSGVFINKDRAIEIYPSFIKPLFKFKLIEVFIKIIYVSLFLKKRDKYDVIDIHYCSSFYNYMLNTITQKSNNLKITIWGSDFYRSDNKYREKQRRIYKAANSIQICTEKMKQDFIDYYQEFDEKIYLARFGVLNFDVIKKIASQTNVSDIKKEFNIPDDKYVIMCGYNSGPAQQHTVIIEEIKKLPAEISENLFLIFQMTYGTHEIYKADILQKIIDLNIPYLFLNEYLPTTSIAKLRLLTDIVINIQTTDALSASLQEHLYAGNILIVGDWLPYDILESNGIFYKPIPTNLLKDTLTECIINIADYKKLCIDNKEKIYNLNSWDSVIKDWIDIYRSNL